MSDETPRQPGPEQEPVQQGTAPTPVPEPADLPLGGGVSADDTDPDPTSAAAESGAATDPETIASAPAEARVPAADAGSEPAFEPSKTGPPEPSASPSPQSESSPPESPSESSPSPSPESSPESSPSPESSAESESSAQPEAEPAASAGAPRPEAAPEVRDTPQSAPDADAAPAAEAAAEATSDSSDPTAATDPTAPTDPTPATDLTDPVATPATPTPAAMRRAVPTPRAVPASPGAPSGQMTSPDAPGQRAGAATSDAASFGRVAQDGTVYVRTPEGERAVGSYPGATPDEALAYFARKYDEVASTAELLFRRVTQTDLSGKDAADSLGKLRSAARDLNAVGDLVALAAKIESIATAVQARRVVEGEQKAAQRQEAMAQREAIVAEAEKLAATPENKVQWKQAGARMRELLDAWKAAQRGGPRLDRETEQALWHRLSASRNSFDKMRRVHFAALGHEQAEAKAAKEGLVAEAEALAGSTDWGATAGAFKRLMDRWRQAGRAARSDDDALWRRFKAAQDAFFAAKDEVSAAENEEFRVNLAVKEHLLEQAQALLPVRNVGRTKQALRDLQDKWDAAGKVPRADLERIEKAMRRVETEVREAEDKKWASSNPEVAARAASLAAQAEASLQKYRRDLEKAEASGDERTISKAREALEARQAWLQQAQAGLAEFGG